MDLQLFHIEDKRERLLWWALATGAAMVAGVATRQLMQRTWRLAGHDEQPEDPQSQDPSWAHALIWAAISGFLVAIGRVVAQRLMASAWEKRTGRKPPGRRRW